MKKKNQTHDSGWNQDLGMQTCTYMEAETHLNWFLDYVMMQSTASQSQQRNSLRNWYATFFFIELSLQNLVYFTLNIVLIWTSHSSVFNSSISSAQHVASNYLIRQCRSIPLISKVSGNCFFYFFFKYMKYYGTGTVTDIAIGDPDKIWTRILNFPNTL